MGVSCGKGKLTIAEDDVIEKSNLSRQFLFRDSNIGEAKATVALSAALSINPSLKAEALVTRVSLNSENEFNDAFWEGLDVVINALDNVEARLYVDRRCVYFQKPLLESGTLGTKCNTQVVIPHATENYGASTDPPEKQAPMCTLHSFPHNIDHCLTWARSEFEGLMEKTPLEANAYLADPEGYLRSLKSVGEMQAKERLQSVVESLIEERCASFEDCLVWARHRFEDCFVSRVKQLISTFPEDATSSSGTPFWSAPKRFPKPLEFNLSDHTCLSFITAASMLRAEIYRLSVPEWASVPSKLAEFVDEIEVPEYKPKPAGAVAREENASGSQPLTNTDNTGGSVSGQDADSDSPIGQLTSALEAAVHKLPLGFSMNPVIFEKDDDSNHHMDLIAGLANLRARNYNIPEVDKLKAKLIAGRIIPAIATTTAMATGLVCLELYKVFLGHRIDMYRNTFANLALPLFSMAEPVSAKTIKHAELSWSVWDRWTIREDLSVRELLDWFQAKGLTAYSVTCGSTCLYNSYFPKHRERMERKLVELARDVAKFQASTNHRHLDLSVGCEDADGNDVEAPLVSISLFQSVNDLPPSGDRA